MLLESSSGIAESIDVSELKIIKIVKGSNIGNGFLLGLLAGGATGAIIGQISTKKSNWWSQLKPLGIVIGGAICGLVGGLIGAEIGSSIHSYGTLQMEGKPQEQIKAVLEKLRSQARFPEYQ